MLSETAATVDGDEALQKVAQAETTTRHGGRLCHAPRCCRPRISARHCVN